MINGKNTVVKGWKAFDQNLCCRGHQFSIGKTYEHPGLVRLCESGFHFHHRFEDRFNYYSGKNTRICEVIANGTIEIGNDKAICSIITIVRELSWREINYGYGYGNGDVYGNGNGDVYGNGNGYGNGDGNGDGCGNGNGNGNGDGYGNGEPITTYME
jgi:hypothetical protein